MTTRQVLLLLVLFIAGNLFALFTLTPKESTLYWHLLEITPLLLGAISYWLGGIYWYVNQADNDSLYKRFGILATFAVVPSIGFVLGLHYIWA